MVNNMKKKEIEQIVKCLDNSLSTKFSVCKVRDLIRENMIYGGINYNIKEDSYNLTIADVLRFYKIKLLVENNIITASDGIKLEKLYLKYLEIGQEIGVIAYQQLDYCDSNSQKLDLLHNQLEEIASVLDQFYILKSETDYTKILETEYLSKFKSQSIEKNSDNVIYTLKKQK